MRSASPDDTRALAGALLSGNPATARGPSLLALQGPRAGERLAVRDGVVIGRGRGADLRLPDGLASRRHARLTRAGSAWRVHDLGSKNGLRVNGRPAAADGIPLAPGDLLTVGASVLVFGAACPSGPGGAAASAAPTANGAPLRSPGRSGARVLAAAAWLTAAAAVAALAA